MSVAKDTLRINRSKNERALYYTTLSYTKLFHESKGYYFRKHVLYVKKREQNETSVAVLRIRI